MLLPRLVDKILNNEQIIIENNGGIIINPINGKDAGISVFNTINLEGFNIINIAGIENLSILGIIHLISKKLKIEPLIKYKNTKPRNLIGDIDKMKSLLHVPKIKLEDGINELLN